MVRNLDFTDPTATSLSIGVVAAISVIITFFMTVILGFLTGLLVMHLCSRKKAVYSLAAKGQVQVRNCLLSTI